MEDSFIFMFVLEKRKKEKINDNVNDNLFKNTLQRVTSVHLNYMSQAMRKRVLFHMRTTKGADQPAHPRSLINTFVVPCLDSIACVLAKSKISRL